VVIPLYLKHGREFPNLLRGMFSFVLYDARDDRCAAPPSIFIAITPPLISNPPTLLSIPSLASRV
jgi:hypothetical protein